MPATAPRAPRRATASLAPILALLAPTLLALALARDAAAHEVRPGYLELRALDDARVAMLWKVPAQGDLRFGIRAVLPERCTRVGESIETWTGDAYVEHATLECRGGLDGAHIAIDGLSATQIEVLVRIVRADGAVATARLTPSAPAFVVAAVPSPFEVARTYGALGLTHLASGADHLLLLLALVLAVGATRRLIATMIAFTLGHSLTLAVATLGVVSVPSPPVQAVIALSVAFVAAEVVRARTGRAALTARAPWLVALAVGLVHGLGFAGALAEVGLPTQSLPLALLAFNVGIEVGELVVVLVLMLAAPAAAVLVRRMQLSWPSWSWRVTPYAIGSLGAYWTLARLARF